MIHARHLLLSTLFVLPPLAVAAAPIPTITTLDVDVIEPKLAATLRTAKPDDRIAVIIHHRQKVDVAAVRMEGPDDRLQAHERVTRALLAHHEATLAPLVDELRPLGGINISSLWVNNSVAVTLPASAIAGLRAHPLVSQITPDSVITVKPLSYSQLPPSQWNIAAINAPQLWNFGYSGQGTVVGVLDTGVDPLHPDLSGRYHGGVSWYDPYGQHVAKPYDASGHGTSVTSLIVGGNADGTDIGVAPGAQWMAARVFNDAGAGYTSNIHKAFQWMLSPDGNPATTNFPNVVNASWDMSPSAGICNREFAPDIQALRASEVAVVFAAGNDGPVSNTSNSPANNPGAFPIGSVDSTRAVASFSSRGPSACDRSIFPALAAPGVNIKAADLTFGGIFLNSYANVSGTTPATAHASGAILVLQGAFPTAKVADIESALKTSALPLGTVGANNNTGAGQLDMLAAYNFLLKTFPPSRPAHLSSTTLVAATYNATTKSLTVQASSTLGNSAGMILAGYGPMKWVAATSLWTISIQTSSLPAIVTISATDGSRSFSTTLLS